MCCGQVAHLFTLSPCEGLAVLLLQHLRQLPGGTKQFELRLLPRIVGIQVTPATCHFPRGARLPDPSGCRGPWSNCACRTRTFSCASCSSSRATSPPRSASRTCRALRRTSSESSLRFFCSASVAAFRSACANATADDVREAKIGICTCHAEDDVVALKLIEKIGVVVDLAQHVVLAGQRERGPIAAAFAFQLVFARAQLGLRLLQFHVVGHGFGHQILGGFRGRAGNILGGDFDRLSSEGRPIMSRKFAGQANRRDLPVCAMRCSMRAVVSWARITSIGSSRPASARSRVASRMWLRAQTLAAHQFQRVAHLGQFQILQRRPHHHARRARPPSSSRCPSARCSAACCSPFSGGLKIC